jgi:hypothetical protein
VTPIYRGLEAIFNTHLFAAVKDCHSHWHRPTGVLPWDRNDNMRLRLFNYQGSGESPKDHYWGGFQTCTLHAVVFS